MPIFCWPSASIVTGGGHAVGIARFVVAAYRYGLRDLDTTFRRRRFMKVLQGFRTTRVMRVHGA